MRHDLLWLSADDVAACGLSPAAMNDAVEAAFKAVAAGEARTRPALSIPVGGPSSFRAKGGVINAEGFGAVKWYGYFPRNAAAGQAEYRPLILLNETETGFPVAVINGEWITATRTAAISAVGAKYLSRPGSDTVAFIGCGTQARSNLEALRAVRPLRRALLCGNRPETTAAFADFVRARGLQAEVIPDPRDALREADIVVSTVPRLAKRTHFLDADWMAPGGFASMVDSGVAWDGATMGAFDIRFSDDVEQSEGHAEKGDAVTTYQGSLAQAVSGASGRGHASQRLALIFSGTGLADAAAAIAVYRAAQALGLGRRLPL
ncbi:ornithine cyclodeaminase family protein [Pseudoroseomonas ludipueritiae]|uniref:Ornithine cyclodeaminase family protein n=1 Tax=Pseudoroseomonas ludipueritiae TaxID=198093 RepID=A0ABR7R2F8_9PROT|nr:ornithine cyclodeaminase family protein [Pseudoroseomonas ludipueritiae]